jgi:hypothetical protein
MKKNLPLAIGICVGFFALLEFYIPWYRVGDTQDTMLRYAQILAAAAFVLGGINVIQVNWPKIKRREADWQFKVVLLGGALLMGLVGVQWHTFGGERENATVRIDAPGEANPGMAVLHVTSERPGVVVSVGNEPLQVAPADFVLPEGTYKVKLYKKVAGYGEFDEDVTLTTGSTTYVDGDLVMKWGPQGRVYTWLYDYVFAPCNATMFALLAFFIASAAFRAFRARNTEAALLLGAAIIIMLGRAPIGRAMSDMFPLISDWILDVPNNAGRRAIMMGAALGAIATGLRVILGLERSHLGSD